MIRCWMGQPNTYPISGSGSSLKCWLTLLGPRSWQFKSVPMLDPIHITGRIKIVDWHIHLGHDVQSWALPPGISAVLVCPYLSRVMPEQLMWHLSEYFTFLSEPLRDNQMPPVSRDIDIIDWPLIDQHIKLLIGHHGYSHWVLSWCGLVMIHKMGPNHINHVLSNR